MATFQDLPDGPLSSIIETIGRCVDRDGFAVIRSVCKTFDLIGRLVAPTVHVHRSTTHPDFPSSRAKPVGLVVHGVPVSFVWTRASAALVTSVSFQGNVYFETPDDWSLFTELSNLASIYAMFCRFAPGFVDGVMVAASNVGAPLQSIVLRETSFARADLLPRFPGLTYLSFTTDIFEIPCVELVQNVALLTNLVRLELGDVHLTDEGMRALAGLTALKYLEIECWTNVTDDGFAHLSGLKLVEARIDGFEQVTDIGMSYLLSTALLSLHIVCVPGPSSGFIGTLVDATPALQRLTIMDFNPGYDRTGGNGLRLLAEDVQAFSKLPLVVLELALHDDTAVSLAPLAECNTLKTVNVWGHEKHMWALELRKLFGRRSVVFNSGWKLVGPMLDLDYD